MISVPSNKPNCSAFREVHENIRKPFYTPLFLLLQWSRRMLGRMLFLSDMSSSAMYRLSVPARISFELIKVPQYSILVHL